MRAADAFDKAAALDPTFALPLNGLGMLSWLAGNWLLAEVLSSGTGSATDFPEVYFNLGVLYQEKGNHESAAGTMKRPSSSAGLREAQIIWLFC